MSEYYGPGDYDRGYENGAESVMDDWDTAFKSGPLGLKGDLEVLPMKVSEALAAILTDEQKQRLEEALRRSTGA